MSVNPGFGGQTFLPRASPRSGECGRCSTGRQPAPVEVDGGIDLDTVGRVVAAGAEILVAGSAIFGAPDPEAAARELKAAAMTRRVVRRMPGRCRPSRRPADDDHDARADRTREVTTPPGPVRRDRPDGRRLLRELPRVVRGRPCEWLRAPGSSYARSSRAARAAGHRGALRVSRAAAYDDEVEIRTRAVLLRRSGSSSTTRSCGAATARVAAGRTVHAALTAGGRRAARDVRSLFA